MKDNKNKKIMDNSDVSIVYDSPTKKENDSVNNNQENKNKGYNMKIKTADGKEEDWNIQA